MYGINLRPVTDAARTQRTISMQVHAYFCGSKNFYEYFRSILTGRALQQVGHHLSRMKMLYAYAGELVFPREHMISSNFDVENQSQSAHEFSHFQVEKAPSGV